MSQSYIVTGGAGFLGRHIVAFLLQDPSSTVAVLDIADCKLDARARVLSCDVTDEAAVDSAFQQVRPTCVIHAAAASPSAPADVQWAVNYRGTRTVLRAAAKHGVRAFVYISDASVVFSGDPLAGADERVGYPRYALHARLDSKAWAESVVCDAHGADGVATISLRPSALFGPGSPCAVHPMVDAFRAGPRLSFEVGDNTNLFDWTYVSNAADAAVLGARALLAGRPVGGHAFFITNGEPRPVWDVPHAIAAGLAREHAWRVTGVPAWAAAAAAGVRAVVGCASDDARLLVQCYARQCAVPQWFDIAKARALLGYRPRVPLEEGVRRTVQWALAENER